jgi:hypothetical protein
MNRTAERLTLGGRKDPNSTLNSQKLSVELAFPFQVIAEKKYGVEQEIQKVLTSEKRVTVKQISKY